MLFSHLLFALGASACSVPVFRYALERWAPAPYELLVFHRGSLSQEQRTFLELVSQKGEPSGEGAVNIALRTVDLDANPSQELADLWKAQKTDSLPAIVLCNPRGSAVDGAIWSGPFTEAAVRQVIDSPVRARMAERLLKGDSAVWLLLESGNQSQDNAAAKVLSDRVQHLQKTLKLAEIEPDDIVKHKISAAAQDLKIAFSVLRISRADPAEAVLVRMLLAFEDDLDDAEEPIAIPVFGRGRALFALVGKGISHETIDEACSFITGPCSCVVKDLNPGQDLLISAEWGSLARADSETDEALLASAGLAAPKPGTLVPIAPGLPAEAPMASSNNVAVSPRHGIKWSVAAVMGALGAVFGLLAVRASKKR